MNDAYELTGRIGPIELARPRTAGYSGGIAMAAAFELIEWPLGLLLAAIPAVRLLDRPDLPKAVQFAVPVFDGMAKPGRWDAEGTIRLAPTPRKLKDMAERAVGTESGRPPRRTRRSAPGTAVQDRSERAAGSEEA